MNAIPELERQFRTLADTASVLIWTSGPDSLRNFCNQAWLQFTGRTAEQELGDGWTEIIHPEDRGGYQKTFSASFEARRPFRMEFRLKRHDGTYRSVLDTAGPHFELDGQFKGYVGSCVDITETKLAEETLRRHRQQLERADADLDRLFYVASHDLQEPLRMVTTYTQLLAHRYEGKLDADADQYIAFAAEGANRIRKLIDDLLEYGYVGRHNQKRRVNLRSVIDQALRSVPDFHQTGAQLEIGDLPEVDADPDHLRKVFHHLLENAVKYRSAGGPRIKITATRQGSYWIVSVEDAGIGIDPRYARRIFDIFQRLHARADYPGTGMGLAVCRKIIEGHGGSIWVDSSPGQGSNFQFTLPASA